MVSVTWKLSHSVVSDEHSTLYVKVTWPFSPTADVGGLYTGETVCEMWMTGISAALATVATLGATTLATRRTDAAAATM
jgi:hypothetical protein